MEEKNSDVFKEEKYDDNDAIKAIKRAILSDIKKSDIFLDLFFAELE